MTLPMVVTSGVTPKYSWAQPLAMRKPVITSSKHSTAPSCSSARRGGGRATSPARSEPESSEGCCNASATCPRPAAERRAAAARQNPAPQLWRLLRTPCGLRTLVHSSRRPCRNSLVGGMKPELPTTGSRISPAISPLLASNSDLTDSKSLYLAVSVAAAVVAGTPGESDRPSVSTPLPACTRNWSAWPW